MNYESIHKIPGFRIGHAEDTAALTGCTVILYDEKTCGGVDQRGDAPEMKYEPSYFVFFYFVFILGIML